MAQRAYPGPWAGKKDASPEPARRGWETAPGAGIEYLLGRGLEDGPAGGQGEWDHADEGLKPRPATPRPLSHNSAIVVRSRNTRSRAPGQEAPRIERQPTYGGRGH